MTTSTPLMRFLRALLTLPAVVAGAVTALYLLLLGRGMLMQMRWLSDRTRQLTKRVNPYLLNVAGTRVGMLYFNLSALHHIGRRSSRAYITPLSAYPLGDGFVLAAAYPHVDWLENVLAASDCTLKWHGREYALERPELLPRAEAIKAYPRLVKPFLAGAAGQNKFVWLHRAAATQAGRSASADSAATEQPVPARAQQEH